MWVMGDGPLREAFQTFAKDLELDVTFFGKVPYPQMCGMLCAGDVCVNPIRKGTAASIINKHADYAASGLPVINTQQSLEYQKLIEAYGCGINCECADPQSIADAIRMLYEDEQLRCRMGKQSRLMAQELFHRGATYGRIVTALCPEYSSV